MVVQHAARKALEQTADRAGDVQLLPRGDDFPQGEDGPALFRRLGKALERDEGEEQALHLLLDENTQQRHGVPPIRLRDQNEGPPLGEGREDLLE
jgi:hypothetical protein